MTTYTAYDEFEMKLGKRTASSGEIRITYDITAGRPARTWANAYDGTFHPAEGPDVQVLKVEYRFHPSHDWIEDTSNFFDEIDTDWLIEQAAEEAA